MVRLIRAVAASLILTLVTVVGLSTIAVGVGIGVFRLTIAGAIALYFVVWWIVLFAILPVGVQSQAESGEVTHGSDPGAPAAPALTEKAIWTTLASAAVFLTILWLLPLTGL